MIPSGQKTILARTGPGKFIGRATHLDRLRDIARSGGGLALLSTPGAGLSELLRTAYDEAFVHHDGPIPVYFEFKKTDRSVRDASARFVTEFVKQAVAFRRRDPSILQSVACVNEIADLAVPADVNWIDIIVNGSVEAKTESNGFAAPLRAAGAGERVIVLFDNAHLIEQIHGGEELLDQICEMYSRSSIGFALGGYRRSMFAKTSLETLAVESFDTAEAASLCDSLSASTGVAVNEQTRDLIAVQLAGNARRIADLFGGAASQNLPLTSFENVQRVYAGEVFGGISARRMNAAIDVAVPDPYKRERIIWLLNESLQAEGSTVPANYWHRLTARAGIDVETVLKSLHENEIVNYADGSVRVDEDILLGDYIRGRAALEIDQRPRALVVGEAVNEYVKRAPELMARHYRRAASLPLTSILAALDGQKISSTLIEYGRFAKEFKGRSDSDLLTSLSSDGETVTLPQIVYSAATASFYPAIGQLCEAERSVTALGFEGKEAVAWLTAQIDSKLEANAEITSFWCDRLEMAAASAELENYKVWLIAPEGFSPEARAVLAERGAYGSSRRQAELLSEILGIEHDAARGGHIAEYEIVIPMGDDTEMIAAHTVEDIARRHEFPAKAINQIKTALVEACINAAEHSLSPDRRIHQRFQVDADSITITITNRGLRLADRMPAEPTPDEGRRGWGLKLIQGLMDEVRVERTDDGTRITMVKRIERADNGTPDGKDILDLPNL